MVLSSVYRKFSSKDCLFCGYTPGYVTKSVGLSEIYLLPLSYTDAFLLSSRVPTSALQSTRHVTMDENDLNSSQFVRKMASNR